MPRPYDKDKTVETVIRFLSETRQPMHYREIAVMLLSIGWRPPTPNPANVLYGRLRSEVLKDNNKGALRFLGNGVFCSESTKGVDCVDSVVIRHQPTPRVKLERQLKQRPAEAKVEYEMRIQRMSEEARCGNCAFINFPDAYILSRTRGNCSHCASEKAGVFSSDGPCELHKFRSEAQRRADEAKQARVKAYVDVENQAVAARKPLRKSNI